MLNISLPVATRDCLRVLCGLGEAGDGKLDWIFVVDASRPAGIEDLNAALVAAIDLLAVMRECQRNGGHHLIHLVVAAVTTAKSSVECIPHVNRLVLS